MSAIIKETHITDQYRVVIRAGNGYFPFLIQTEQKASDFLSAPWEVDAEGWRACISESACTHEEADEKYERQIADERRWH